MSQSHVPYHLAIPQYDVVCPTVKRLSALPIHEKGEQTLVLLMGFEPTLYGF